MSFHAYSYKARICGPNVVHQSTSVGRAGDVGPHMKWCKFHCAYLVTFTKYGRSNLSLTIFNLLYVVVFMTVQHLVSCTIIVISRVSSLSKTVLMLAQATAGRVQTV